MIVYNIAHCQDHGLHGERTRCYECNQQVDQVSMVELAEYEALRLKYENERILFIDVVSRIQEERDALLIKLLALRMAAGIILSDDNQRGQLVKAMEETRP